MEKKIEDLIKNYLRNSISKDELTFLKRWVSSKENERLFKNIVSKYYRDNAFDTPRALELLESRIFEEQSFVQPKKNQFVWLKYAAVFVGVLAASYFAYFFNQSPKTEFPVNSITLEVEGVGSQVLSSTVTKDLVGENGEVLAKQTGNALNYLDANNGGAKVTYNILKVPYGETFQLFLADHTHVYLNSGSSLRYPSKFVKGQAREVFLEGEAYFKVSKSKEIPFIVRANNFSTEVFGTEFNVTSYPDDDYDKVVLVEGSVGVYDKGDRFDEKLHKILKPKEIASKRIGDSILISEVDVNAHIAWLNGALFFKNEKFKVIKKKLQRHYDKIIVNNYQALDEKRFTGRFDIETIEQVLITFQKTNNFNYVVKGKNIIINP